MTKTITIKNLELGGNVPRIVGIVDQPVVSTRLRRFVDRGVDMFEIRADLFNRGIGKIVDYVKMIRQTVASPMIGTIRETDFNRADRVEWYVSLSRHVDIVDIELGMPHWRELVDRIMSPTVIMVSEHDFGGTPDMRGLNDIVKRAADQGAEFVKIAVTANSAGDVTRLMRFTEDCEMPVITMAMGGYGAISRVTAPLFGSLFSYGYLRKPLVPGQMAAVKMAAIARELSPKH